MDRFFVGSRTATKLLSLEELKAAGIRARVRDRSAQCPTGPDGLIACIDADTE